MADDTFEDRVQEVFRKAGQELAKVLASATVQALMRGHGTVDLGDGEVLVLNWPTAGPTAGTHPAMGLPAMVAALERSTTAYRPEVVIGPELARTAAVAEIERFDLPLRFETTLPFEHRRRAPVWWGVDLGKRPSRAEIERKAKRKAQRKARFVTKKAKQ